MVMVMSHAMKLGEGQARMHLNSLSRIGQLAIAILVLGAAVSASAPMSQLTEHKGQTYLHSPEDVSGLPKQ